MEAHSSDRTDRFAGDLVRLIPGLLLLAIVVWFALSNTEKTEVDLIVTDTEASLVLVLAATVVLGAVIGALLRFRRQHHH